MPKKIFRKSKTSIIHLERVHKVAVDTQRAVTFDTAEMYSEIIRTKLPHLASKWAKKMARTNSTLPTFRNFIEFLKEHNEHAEETADILKSHDSHTSKGRGTAKVAATTTEFKPASKEHCTGGKSSISAPIPLAPKAASTQGSACSSRTGCPLCSEHHLLENCRKFNGLSPTERSKIVWDNRRCFKCLTPDHFATHCTVAKTCTKCQKPHHTLLHGATRPETRTTGSSRGRGPPNQSS